MTFLILLTNIRGLNMFYCKTKITHSLPIMTIHLNFSWYEFRGEILKHVEEPYTATRFKLIFVQVKHMH